MTPEMINVAGELSYLVERGQGSSRRYEELTRRYEELRRAWLAKQGKPA